MTNHRSIIFASALLAASLFFVLAPHASANCSPSLGGDHTITSNCSFTGSVNGVDNGNLTVNAGVTLTINANQTIAFNAGKSITVNGAIAISASGAQIKQTNLWIYDFDGDGYTNNSMDMIAQDSKPANYERRSTRTATGDCNDTSASAWQNLSGYTDADSDGYGTGSLQSVCSGSSLASGYTNNNNTDCNDTIGSVYRTVPVAWDWDVDQDGYTYTDTNSPSGSGCVGGNTTIGGRTYYYDNLNGYSVLAWSQRLLTNGFNNYDCNDTNASVAANKHLDADGDGYGINTVACVAVGTAGYVNDGTDCSDANANIYQNQSVATDSDQDGYSIDSASTQCVGGSTTASSRTYYKNASGGYSFIAQGNIIGTNDCYDSSANARPNQTAFFSTNRGDGSFDYNCDGSVTKGTNNGEGGDAYCNTTPSPTPSDSLMRSATGASCADGAGFSYCPTANIVSYSPGNIACGTAFPGRLVSTPLISGQGWEFYAFGALCTGNSIGRYAYNVTTQTCR